MTPREAFQQISAAMNAAVIGPGNRGPAPADRFPRRWSRPHGRAARRGQDALDQDARQTRGERVLSRAVHARSAAIGRDRLGDLSRTERQLRFPARPHLLQPRAHRRGQPLARERCRRLCSKAMEERQVTVAGKRRSQRRASLPGIASASSVRPRSSSPPIVSMPTDLKHVRRLEPSTPSAASSPKENPNIDQRCVSTRNPRQQR